MTIATRTSTTPPATLAPIKHQLATRSKSDVKALPAVLKSEWIKLSSLRANRAILALPVLVGAFVSWAVATLVTDEVLVVSEVFSRLVLVVFVVPVFVGIFAA